MKLLTVGSAPQSNLFFNSSYVSGYHADILILDNGDTLVVDRNSTNGTFVNGNRLAPDVEVVVRRSDKVVFADSVLDWGRVPSIKIDADAKQILGVGSHPRNRYRITGDKVSRFHATFKQTNDGKWFICDHSTNGTTVNGVRIAKDIYVRIKKDAQIKCAGIPVENPNKRTNIFESSRVVVACVIAVAAAIVGFFVIPDILDGRKISDSELNQKYSPSTAFIICNYHYKISAGSLAVSNFFGADEFTYDSNGEPLKFNGENSNTCTATGFFISDDGLLATNLHVARPWVVYSDYTNTVEDYFRSRLNRIAQNAGYGYVMPYVSQLKVEGVIDNILVVPTGNYFDGKNAISCSEVAVSENSEIDIAVLRVRNGGGELPKGATFIHLEKTDVNYDYKNGAHVYTFGYPYGTALQDIQNKQIQTIGVPGSIMNVNNKNTFMVNATVKSGASGSPVFDDRGKLIGIMSLSDSQGFAVAVRVKYLIDILNKELN